jgi:hypothetical protein
VPVWNFDRPVRILAGPYEYGDPAALPVMEMGDPVIAAGD